MINFGIGILTVVLIFVGQPALGRVTSQGYGHYARDRISETIITKNMVCTSWILTFLLIAVASQSQETPELENKVHNQKIFIDTLNNFRRQTANKLRIAYMHELVRGFLKI